MWRPQALFDEGVEVFDGDIAQHGLGAEIVHGQKRHADQRGQRIRPAEMLGAEIAVQLVGRDKPYRRALVPERGSHAGKQKRLAQPRRPQQQKVLLVRFREPVCIAAQKVAVPQGGFALRARGECHGVEFGKRAKRHAGIFPVRMLHGLAHAAHPPPVGG